MHNPHDVHICAAIDECITVHGKPGIPEQSEAAEIIPTIRTAIRFV